MSIRKRISQILTPPIRHKSQAEETSLPSKPEIGEAARIGDILQRLLIDKKQDADSIQAELSDLREIASKYGSYMTACEIQECVSSMPNEDENGRAYKKGRGFELAADLHQQNISKTIVAISEGRIEVESEVLSTYCGEVLECLFLAKKYRKAIQVCLLICEDMVLRGCTLSKSAPIFLPSAKNSVQAILERALREKERAERIYNRAKRENRKFDTPMPDDSRSPDAVDEDLLAYLNDFRQKIAHVASSFNNAHVPTDINYNDLCITEAGDISAKYLAYTELLRKISSDAEYRSLEVFAYEKAGAIRDSMLPGNGLRLFEAAARVSEEQAESERERKLILLSRRRYEKASELWILAGDTAQAEKARTAASGLAKE